MTKCTLIFPIPCRVRGYAEYACCKFHLIPGCPNATETSKVQTTVTDRDLLTCHVGAVWTVQAEISLCSCDSEVPRIPLLCLPYIFHSVWRETNLAGTKAKYACARNHLVKHLLNTVLSTGKSPLKHNSNLLFILSFVKEGYIIHLHK